MYEDLIAEAGGHVSDNDVIEECPCSSGRHGPYCRWCGNEWPCITARLRDALVQAENDRDEAIAHDRQPYPTSWAYDQACAALEKHRTRAEDNAEKINSVRSAITSGRVFRTSSGQPVIDVGYIWEALGEGEE